MKKLTQEIKSHVIIYVILGVILIGAFFVRVYRINELLGFYFDQGRDALVIWDFIHNHKFFLIGPTTGLAGIFRGPYYYYLIAPAYFLGRGDPVWPSIFLSVTTGGAIILIYFLGAKIQSRVSGIIAAIIAAFSFYIVMASRWLSNPTPMLLLSMILVWSMMKIAYGTKREEVQKWWVVISLVSGLSLFNFGSSGEFFYFPALLVFAMWQRRKLPTLKYFLFSGFVFFLTFAPLVIFDLKHDHILLNNFTQTFGQSSFKNVTKFIFEERTKFYWDVFTNKLFESRGRREIAVIAIALTSFLALLPKMLKNKGTRILLLLLVSPIIGLYFYQGNYAVVYDYYMTGYYLIFILLFAIVLGNIWRLKLGAIFVVYFFYLFLMNNLSVIDYKLSDKSDGPQSIGFVNQKQAIEWIYQDAKNQSFNVDVYVPPVIPYAYDYLLKWYPTTAKFEGTSATQVEEQVPTLYTLYEVDSPHPERLDVWLARQKGIGRVEETYRTGGITVERRIRIK